MTTIYLDGRQYHDAKTLHADLQRLLQFPEYYGRNADAFHDCLDEMNLRLRLVVMSSPEGEVLRALKLIGRVIEDDGGICDWRA